MTDSPSSQEATACAYCRTAALCAEGGCAAKDSPPEGNDVPVAWRDAHDHATLYHQHPGPDYEVEPLFAASTAREAEVKRLRTALESFVKDGLRHDPNPTVMFPAGDDARAGAIEMYTWWVGYFRSAEESVKNRAREALKEIQR